ncbi:HlyD family efflux transporter periplasmic adaptor subunit [Cyanobium sp. NIES-981]|uniref:HlyD family efflux transporter periplasmic adaptor subunit n=1 Tax=Cyanobium sp. NIES-981 TaxID=1851505 RepID=UPI0007DE0D5E|nr:HlyD family efflux transporter periplasmic adaptor subunit [Cyanobium sp. NIES-981]SBO44341.1 Multidrug resistance efflux pump [Cyanobium sp. NIES-981]
MLHTSSGFSGLVDRCRNWLRPGGRNRLRGQGFGPSSEPIQAVKVDLVGTGRKPTDQPDEPTATFGASTQPPQPPVPAGAFRSDLAPAPSASTAPWTFSQTVLLRKKRRGSRVLLWTGIGTVVLLGTWAVTAPLAETIAVPGKLEPGTSTKRVDAPVPGVVEAVLVKEGQRVRKGDPLVRFDLREPRSLLTAAEANRERLVNENQIAAATLGDSAATAKLTPNQRLQLSSQAEELASRRESARQELRKAETRLQGYRATLATYANIANRYAQLEKVGAVSEVQLLEARNQVQEYQNRIAEEQREILRLQSQLVNTGAVTNVELRRKVEENLRLIADLDNQIKQARLQIQYGQLTAPVDGLVFDVEVSPGSVVAQGTGSSASASTKALMKVVPQDALQARVYLPNKAVGFVVPGQKAELAIDAFESGNFGTVPATVERVASDALTSEEQTRVLGTQAQGLYFPAVLKLDQQTIKLRNSTVPLQAGMSLQADIKLRERRFIDIFTSMFTDQRRLLEQIR